MRGKWLHMIQFGTLLLTSLSMSVAMAHLFELPNKISLSAEEYLVVQQIYRGWSLAGILVIGAMIITLVLVIMVRKSRKVFTLTIIALLCLLGSQILFWVFTFPANRVTDNWTTLPSNWMELREQWEYSHATGAVLHLIAMITLILSVLSSDKQLSMK